MERTPNSESEDLDARPGTHLLTKGQSLHLANPQFPLQSNGESLTNFIRLGSALKEIIKGFWKAFCKYENFLEIIII